MTTLADAPPAPTTAQAEAGAPPVEIPSTSDGPAAPAAVADPPLSKNQAKKLRRYEEKKARITALKAAAKASRAVDTAARRAAACARIDTMTPDEKAAWRAAKAAKQAVRRGEAAAKAARLDAASAPGAPVPHVIIDLDPAYDALMTPREKSSLASQLRACYASNAASPHPLRLTFAGCSPGWEAALGGESSGKHAWRVGRTPAGFVEAAVAAVEEGRAGKDGEKLPPGPATTTTTAEIVYLSADAAGEVATLRPGVAYVIGGLVDRNRHKGIAARRAAAAAAAEGGGASPGVAVSVTAARLPIGPALARSASAVLTVDQVARLLVAWWAASQSGGGDAGAWWGAAVEAAVPPRKRRQAGEEGGGEGASEGEDG